MKVTLTRKEVEQIVLAHIQQSIPSADLNTCEISDRWSSDFCTVTHEEPQQPVQMREAA